ncbi:hypothetical protein EON65_09025 [archaeon]|nr:MAG: hypothetical protein EON65_09025 [archaeon]
MPIFLAMTKIWRKELGLITLCLFFRIILLMITCTSYVPDEYYQYQELVSKILFGQGIVYVVHLDHVYCSNFRV